MKNILSTLVISLAMIVSALLFSKAWIKSHNRADTINVTGLAQKNFASDLIVWKGSFSRKSLSIKEAYPLLKQDAERINGYLHDKGVSEKKVVFSSVEITKEFKHIREKDGSRTDTFDGFTLTQSVQIESHDVNKVEEVSREITELINQGVELNSRNPQYYYTKLAELKIEMLANATADGKQRATQIANNAGTGLGELKSANMGVFQITAQNSTEDYSYGGALNTGSKNKTASITVRLEFTIH